MKGEHQHQWDLIAAGLEVCRGCQLRREAAPTLNPHATPGARRAPLTADEQAWAAHLRCERIGNGNYRCRSRKAANDEARRKITSASGGDDD